MNLVIVESPAKSKTIKKYLGPGYTVRASVGHVRDLPKSNKKAINIEGGFVPSYEVNADKEKVLNELKTLTKKASQVLLATDPDREGEAIAWHVAKVLELDDKKTQRIVFNEITKPAVQDALENPRKINQSLRRAQEARRVLDRLVGYDLSGLIWKKVRYGLSAGRVQSPALRIIMEREREIRAFEPIKYYIITADLLPKGQKEILTFTCGEQPRDKKEVNKILKVAKKDPWQIIDIQESEVKRNPLAPFITSTLQQTASNRLGFAPSQTMMLAQRLYEAGLITYMRTDSTTMSQTAIKQIARVVTDKFGKEYFVPKTFAKKSKNAQEAHEAIRPTKFDLESAGKDTRQQKLYKLIWSRAVASQMAPAKLLRTKIIANVEKEKIPGFTIIGSRTLFPGWLRVDPIAKKEDVELPLLQKGDPLKLKEINAEEKETQPPNRYTEAGLIKELEKRGIGRPSTYAAIIRTIKDRGYVNKEGKTLFPSDTGEVVSDFLEKNFKKYISDTFTAGMEDQLDEIAQGKIGYKETLENFYGPFTEEVKKKSTARKITNLGKAEKKFKCPECKDEMVIKLGKNGKFLSCKRFPKCTGARTIEGKEIQGPKETGEKCPDCGGNLVEREGRYGLFTACGNYPKCKHIKKDPKQEEKAKTGVTCPKCQKGELMERRGRYGIFYGCSNYPNCRHAIKAKPTGKICDYPRPDRSSAPCGELIMEGTKTIPNRCSDKNCPNHNPHKL